MATYPNQETILIQKPAQYPNTLYTQIGQDELHYAINDLTPTTLKLWLYLMQNSPKWEENYSKKAFMNWANVSEAAARKAMYELKEKHYINMRSNTYAIFTPVPNLDADPQWLEGF